MRNVVNGVGRTGAAVSLVVGVALIVGCVIPVAPLPEPVFVEGGATAVVETPAPVPAPAPSSGSRQLADYYYYPDAEVYFSPTTRYYYWYTDGDWHYGLMLPGWIQLTAGPVQLRLLAGRPYYRHATICKRYGYHKTRYYYYPHAEVYFNPGVGVWFWYRNGNWHSGFSLPSYIRIDYHFYVETDLRYSRPYYHHRDIRHRYPPTGSYSRRSMPRIPTTAPPSYVPSPPPGLTPPGSGSGSGRTGMGPGPHGGAPGSGGSSGGHGTASPPSSRPGTSPPGLTPPTSIPGGSGPSVSPPSTGSGSGGRTTRPPTTVRPPATVGPPTTVRPGSGVQHRTIPPSSTPSVPQVRVTPPTGSGGSTGSTPSRTRIRTQRRVELPRRTVETPNTDTGVNRPVDVDGGMRTPVLPPTGTNIRPDAGDSHSTPGRLAPPSQFPSTTPGVVGTPGSVGRRTIQTEPGRR